MTATNEENQYTAEAYGELTAEVERLKAQNRDVAWMLINNDQEGAVQWAKGLEVQVIDGETEVRASQPQPKGTPSLDDIYKAWHTIGADVAGLSWSRFVELLPSHVPSQETKE